MTQQDNHRYFHVIELPETPLNEDVTARLQAEWAARMNDTFGLFSVPAMQTGVGRVPHHTRLWWSATTRVNAIAVFAETLSALYGHAFLHLWVPADETGAQPDIRPSDDTVIDTYVNGRHVDYTEQARVAGEALDADQLSGSDHLHGAGQTQSA